jgi:hypothetical protein
LTQPEDFPLGRIADMLEALMIKPALSLPSDYLTVVMA